MYKEILHHLTAFGIPGSQMESKRTLSSTSLIAAEFPAGMS